MRLILVLFFLPFVSFSLNEISFEKGKALFGIGEKDAANSHFYACLSDTMPHLSAKGELALNIARFYRANFEFNQTDVYLGIANQIADSIASPYLKIDVLNEYGLLFYDQHQFTAALSNFSMSLEKASSLKDTVGMTVVLINIGNVFKETKDYESALFYYHEALAKVQNLYQSNYKSILLINIGSIYYLQKRLKEALAVMKLAEPLTIVNNDPLNFAHLAANMGLCYLELGDYLAAQKKLNTALVNYRSLKNIEGIYLCQVNLFRVATKLKNKNASEEFLKIANDTSYAHCNLQTQLDFQTYKRDYFLQIGDSASAFIASYEIIRLQSLHFETVQNRQLHQLKSDVNYKQAKGQLSALKNVLIREKKEKMILDDLNNRLKKQNSWIIFLSTLGLILFIAFVFFLIRSNRRKKRLNQSLRAQKNEVERKSEEILNSMAYANAMEKLLLQQMNPHFLYNALMTVDASITTGDTEFAKEYLSLFSELLRKTLDNSRKDVVSLDQEIDFLKAYVKLNAIKQGPDFECQFIYDEEDVEDFVYTPPMLVQPFIENALIHGLYHKVSGKKELTIRIQPKKKHILWTIIDNGIGREKAKEIGKTHKGLSHGIKITVDRINWMKKRYEHDFSVQYIDLENGTKVILKTPIMDN